jgi:hypothetical protein
MPSMTTAEQYVGSEYTVDPITAAVVTAAAVAAAAPQPQPQQPSQS